MKNIFRYWVQATGMLIGYYICGIGVAYGQVPAIPQIDVAIIAEFSPSHFPSYNPVLTTGTSANGDLIVKIYKLSGGSATIPPNSFSVIVTLPETLPSIADPVPVSGFAVTRLEPHVIQIAQTGTYSGNVFTSETEIRIPVQATAPIPAGSSYNWVAEIQQEDYTYQDVVVENNKVEGRITVENNALPVKLISFKATEEEGAAHLTWTTTEEKDFAHFEVERSLLPDNGFTSIGRVSAKGVNGKGNSYGLTDREAPRGQMIYYRLKMVDLDGSHVYSRIESLELSGITASVYPNPAREFLKVKATEPIRALELINMSGVGVNRTFYEGNRTEETLELRNVGSGIYQVKITGKEGSITYRKVAIAD